VASVVKRKWQKFWIFSFNFSFIFFWILHRPFTDHAIITTYPMPTLANTQIHRSLQMV